MPPRASDAELIDAMKQREFHIKGRQRAAEAVRYEVRRYRAVMLVIVAVVGAALVTGILFALTGGLPETGRWWRATGLVAAVGLLLGLLAGQALLSTPRGRRHLAAREARSRARHGSDLHAGRRWLQFDHRGEDIAPYIPQVLHYYGSAPGLETVDAVLEFVKGHQPEGPLLDDRSRERFDRVAGQVNTVVVATTDESGHPACRVMHFVRSDEPGVWCVTTAPEAPKVQDLDRGAVALVTVPTEDGTTVSSNQVQVRRLGRRLQQIAHLYRDQVPGYLEELTPQEQESELVFELRLLSARIDSWVEHGVVVFDLNGRPGQ